MSFAEKLYLSTIGEDAMSLAAQYNLGLEMAEFCTAQNLDDGREEWEPVCRERMKSAARHVFHAPFNEMCTAAVDPLVRRVTMYRFRQALDMALSLGIHKLVYHSTNVPILYFDSYFTEESIKFWKEFLSTAPDDIQINIENVVDIKPDIIFDIVRGVDDPRCRICLDVGHAHVSSEIPAEEWVRKMGPLLGHIHVHDNPGDHDWHMPLGQGNINWEELFPLIAEEAPDDVTYTIENMECRDTITWLINHNML